MDDREAYILAIESAQKLVEACGAVPIDMYDRAAIVTKTEGILFQKRTVPPEFRKISDLYIAKGLVALSN